MRGESRFQPHFLVENFLQLILVLDVETFQFVPGFG